MKKLFAILALAGVMVSCNNKKKEEKKTEGDTTVIKDNTTTNDNMGDKTVVTGDIPTFSDPEVQKYVNDYTEFVTAYVNAYTTKDMTKIQEYATKMTDWTSRSMSVSQKLAANPSDAQKFSDYMTKLSERLTAAMQMK